MSKKIQLLVITLLLALNYYAILNHSIFYNRVFRLMSLLTFFVLYLKIRSKKNGFLLYVFLFFMLSDILLFFYEKPIFSILTSVSRICGYLLILNHFRKQLDLKKNR